MYLRPIQHILAVGRSEERPRLRFLDLGRLANVADQGCLLVPEKTLEGWRVLGDRPCDHDDARGLLLHPGVNDDQALVTSGVRAFRR